MAGLHDRVDLPQSLHDLEHDIAPGDFLAARDRLNKLGETILEKSILALPPENPIRMRAAATLAEIHTYFGENASTRRLLEPFERGELLISAKAIRPRAKLQLAELFYARRQFKEAIRLAEQILNCPETNDDLWGTGESYYYLARYYARLNRTAQAAAHCARALEYFSRAAGRSHAAHQGLMWRTGLVLLIEGNSKWRSGHLTEARGTLHASISLLRQTRDVIALGNTHQSLGCILRSQGGQTEAQEEFRRAHAAYKKAGHKLNEARVLTNIARTYLTTRDFAKADDCLRNALDVCEVGSIAESATSPEDPMWQRQKAEALVWRSLFCQQLQPLPDLKEAVRCANDAISLAANPHVRSLGTEFEARIALGYCAVREGNNLGDAKKHFTKALAIAETLQVAKLKVNANLSLAQLYCEPSIRNLDSAQKHYSRAQALIDGAAINRAPDASAVPRDGEPTESAQEPEFSAFLLAKSARIWEMIRSSGGNFLLRPEDLGGSGLQLRQAVASLKAWAIEVTEQRYGGIEKVAAVLGVSRQHCYAIKKRSKQTTTQRPIARP